MFFDDHKKAVTTIMSKRTPKGEVSMSPSPMKMEVVKNEDGEVDGMHLAAQDILGAHHSKSPEQLMHALSNFIDLHMSKPKASEE